jgi:hypothetical protein
MQDLDCKRVIWACPYYNERWKSRFLTFLQSVDLVIEDSLTFTEQRLLRTTKPS